MIRPIQAGVVASMLLLASGCAYVLHPNNRPSQQKLHISNSGPERYAIRVNGGVEYSVAADGRVIFEVPALPRGCSTYLFGVVKIGDGSPERLRAIEVLREGRPVRRLSLKDLEKLRADAEGYRCLRL